MATRMPLEQTMTVIEKPHVCVESWWCEAPRAGFTQAAETRIFRPLKPRRGERIRTIAEEIADASD